MDVPVLPRVELSSRRDEVYRLLRRAIVRGEISVGTRLVASQLADQLGVSRTPLREALQLLEREGFVRRLATGVVEVVGLSRDEIEEVFAIRAALEGLAARYAALRAGPEEVDRMARTLAATERSARKSRFEEVDVEGLEFHTAIQRASGLKFATGHLETMRDHINRYRARTIATPGRAVELVGEHAEILKCIRLRDPDQAEAAMRRHIWNAWLVMKQAVSNQGSEAQE
ncbi:MAG: GntR family transcriptional regulator [Bacillota bacterium]|nr:GntR family transcriptional regulator [Bacillota bacterium]